MYWLILIISGDYVKYYRGSKSQSLQKYKREYQVNVDLHHSPSLPPSSHFLILFTQLPANPWVINRIRFNPSCISFA